MTFVMTRVDKLKVGDPVEISTPDFTTMSRWRDPKSASSEHPSTISVIGYFLDADKTVIRLNGMRVAEEDGPEIGQLAIIPRNDSITIRRLRGHKKGSGRSSRRHKG